LPPIPNVTEIWITTDSESVPGTVLSPAMIVCSGVTMWMYSLQSKLICCCTERILKKFWLLKWTTSQQLKLTRLRTTAAVDYPNWLNMYCILCNNANDYIISCDVICLIYCNYRHVCMYSMILLSSIITTLCTPFTNVTYWNLGLWNSLFIITASNIGPSRTINSIILWIRRSSSASVGITTRTTELNRFCRI
jgi:hypothetical protein